MGFSAPHLSLLLKEARLLRYHIAQATDTPRDRGFPMQIPTVETGLCREGLFPKGPYCSWFRIFGAKDVPRGERGPTATTSAEHSTWLGLPREAGLSELFFPPSHPPRSHPSQDDEHMTYLAFLTQSWSLSCACSELV